MHSRVARSPASFQSVKSSALVPVVSALRLDFLLQSALDPSVDEIDYVQSTVISGCRVRLDLPIVVRKRVRFAVDIVDDHPLRTVDDEGLSLLAVQDLGLEVLELCRDDIDRDPIADNARRVWRHVDYEVCFDDETAALHALSEQSLALDRLTAMTGVSAEAVFALACADLVILDIESHPLFSGTMVSVNPRHMSRSARLRAAAAQYHGRSFPNTPLVDADCPRSEALRERVTARDRCAVADSDTWVFDLENPS
ncbi:hypothetical protein [Bradyrhizobium genosp. P]|uniref:hypothetical protein n=1 Tax=Bradyrhizobium genosp. P TaxID=83641 RepID=UPI003CF83EEF